MTTQDFELYLKKRKIYWSHQGRFRIKSSISFDINDGWLQILHDCFEEMFLTGWNGELLQVKEKFGGLRIYLSGYYPEIEEIIIKYSKLSYTVCERCSTTENVESRSSFGWSLTLCPTCRQEYENAKNNNTKQLPSEGGEIAKANTTP